MLLEITLLGGAFYAMKKNFREQTQRTLAIVKEETSKAIVIVDKKLKPVKKVKQNTEVEHQSKSDQSDQSVTHQKPYDLKSIELHEENQKMTRDFTIITGSTIVSIVGYLAYPPWYLLSLPGWLYVSIPAFKQAFQDILQGKPNVNQIYSITALGCLGSGYYVTGNFAALFYVLSKKLSVQLKQDSRNSLIDVFNQHPKTVFLWVDGIEVETPYEALIHGDIVVVTAGATIPVDGIIITGTASIDQHILTGEAQPVEKEINDSVFAATLVLTGKIYVRVEKAGDETTAAQIGEILNQTTEFKTAGQMRAESLAQQTVLPTLVAGGLSLPLLGPMGALAVINAHFSYRLSAVSSIAVFSYLRLISQQGILIKKGEVLDLLPQVDTIIFDKTGTLTLSKPHIGQIYPFDNYNEEQILALAAAAENKQTHPIALAILEAANARALLIPEVQEVAYQIGYGLQVQIDNQWVQVGSHRFMQRENIILPPSIQTLEAQAEEQSYSLILVALNGKVIGALELLPTIRPEAQAVIDNLKQLPQVEKTYIISGDNEKPTQQLADILGIDDYFAPVLPQEKAALIEELQNAGKIVCYIGDGINDSIALKKANVSISLSGASTIATDTAQIILMGKDLNQLCDLFQLAYEFDKTVQQGFHAVMTPTVIGIGGAFFLTFDVMDTIILKQLGLTIGLINATYPLIKYREKRNEGVQSEAL